MTASPITTSLINADGRVLGCIDPSVYAASVASLSAWAAARLGAPHELLHTIERAPSQSSHDFSGSLSLGSQEELLTQLASLDEQRGKLAQEHGRLLLEQARAQSREAHGVEAQVRQRHGELVEALLELEPEVRLFVLGKRGAHADFNTGHLGSNLERVVRAVHRPVLVASRTTRALTRFLIAFDGSATTRRCVEMVCASPLLKGLACDVLMVGESTVNAAHMEWAITQLQAAGFQPQAHVAAGSADAVIAEHVVRLSIDLLVMGAYGHSRIRTMIVGSTTTQVLRQCQIPVLLLR